MRWAFRRRHGSGFQHGFSHSACFSSIEGCPCVLQNKSPNQAAAAAQQITQQSTRPRDGAGLQTGLVIPSHTSLIKHCIRLFHYHLPKQIPPFLFQMSAVAHAINPSPPCPHGSAITSSFSQEGSLEFATLSARSPPSRVAQRPTPPRTHQWGPFAPQHRHTSDGVLLSRHLGFQCHWDVH